jgi:hypothetical protein
MRSILICLTALISSQSQAFCGFYVGKADSSLFNEASQVILVRDGPRTVLSMQNDYKGELTDFAMVVPVPTILQRSQINVGDKKIFDRIDGFSAPRLAEYFDENPCQMRRVYSAAAASAPMPTMVPKKEADQLGVKVEATYQVGEYDIVILSANQSDGLETWLTQSGYKIPKGAGAALKPYINQGMKFFVAKVNIKEQTKTGFTQLRPLQFAFESEKFMLPMRLGMLNANGPQDLILYTLTRNGRVESSNYRTQKLPANMDLPVHIRGEFKPFYKALFDQAAKNEGYKVVWTEYFWDMAWCDPCAADPLNQDELRQAGVFWLNAPTTNPGILPRMPAPQSAAQPVLLTRLHLRYTPASFPEDLMLQETKDKQNFQTRYVLRHPWKGEAGACDAAKDYVTALQIRQEKEAQTLATLTGWDINVIRSKMQLTAPKVSSNWWDNLWSPR